MEALIVDDEPFVRKDLRELLAAHPDVAVIGEAATVAEAIRELKNKHPDVIFLDIQLRGGSGFDLVPEIDPAIAVIFVTAYETFAIRAFEVNALDYLLKPISAERLSASLDRLRGKCWNTEQRAKSGGGFGYDDHVFIRTGSGMQFIPVADIVAITAEGGNYTVLHLYNGACPLVRRTLKAWEERLPGDIFLRIHRANIVNKNCIQRIQKKKNGCYRVHLAGLNAPLESSRRLTARLTASLS